MSTILTQPMRPVELLSFSSESISTSTNGNGMVSNSHVVVSPPAVQGGADDAFPEGG